jgi:hypothetical protein
MRRARAIVTTTLAALLSLLSAATIEAESGKRGVTQSSKSVEQRSGRGNANAQWSADPERGWVRADERHIHEPSDSPKKRSDGRQHGKRNSKKL